MEQGSHFQLPDHIQFEENQFNRLTNYLDRKKYSAIFILVDENTKEHCLPLVEKGLQEKEINYIVLMVPAGENSKSIEVCNTLWQSITENKADRKSLLINLGGGMITDLGGFVGAVYKRGIDTLNIPTSLLAMVDASVGGKCGIDFQGYKNQLGVFNTPNLCLIYPKFLATLPQEELLSGYAEVLKHIFIGKELILDRLPDFSTIPPEEDIRNSIHVKSKIVEQDPFEKGERKKLNFGHTIGHAIESYFLEKGKPIAHGIAIAAGMFCELVISQKLGLLSIDEMNKLQGIVTDRFPKISFSKEELPAILKFLYQDKKNENGQLLFSLLKGVGNCVVNQPVKEKYAEEALLTYVLY